MKKILSSSAGFTLPEIMMSMGIMGLISLVGMHIYQNASTNENYLRAQSEISKKVGLIENVINSKKSCLLMLKGVRIDAPLNELSITRADGVKNIVLQDGNDYGDFYLQSGTGLENASIYLKQSAISTSTVDLYLNFKTKKKVFLNTNNEPLSVTKKISFLAEKDDAGQIAECGVLVGATNLSAGEKACYSLGDFAVWENGECKLQGFSCPQGQVMQDLGSVINGSSIEEAGTPTCVDIKDKFQLSDLFDMNPKNCTNRTTYQLYASDSGKVSIQCDGWIDPPVINNYITTKCQCVPINGGINWGPGWSSCSGGKRYRSGTCDNPSPNSCGQGCGNLNEEDTCTDPVDPTGGEDGGGDEGGGNQGGGTQGGGCQRSPNFCENKQSNVCSNQEVTDNCGNGCGINGTKNCSSCTRQDGGWSEPTSWSECNKKGFRTGERSCTNPTPECGGSKCSGDKKITESCTYTGPGNNSGNGSGGENGTPPNCGQVCCIAFSTPKCPATGVTVNGLLYNGDADAAGKCSCK